MKNLKRILVCVIAFVSVGSAIALSADPQTVAYWRFEEGTANANAVGANTILDSSGNNLNGTPYNNPVYRANVPVATIPQTGAADALSMQFGASYQRVFISDDPKFQLTHSLTLEAWIKPTSSTQYGILLVRANDRPGHDPYYLSVNDPYDTRHVGSNIDFRIENDSGGEAYVSAALPPLNQWSHIAATLDDSTGAIGMYINGTLVAMDTTSIRPFAALSGENPGIGIGNLQWTIGDEPFAGLIDEVRITNGLLAPNQFLDAVPEPAMLSLLALGGLGVLGRVARRRKS